MFSHLLSPWLFCYNIFMKIYLDLCVYNRPFDYQGQERISLETEAFIYLLNLIEEGRLKVVTSEVLLFENNKNPDIYRSKRIDTYFSLSKIFVKIDDKIVKRGRVLENYGLSAIDALHIAAAEKAKVDYFLTCDDGIIKFYSKKKQLIKVKVTGLLEFVSILTKESTIKNSP